MILAKEQRIGVIILCVMVVGTWVGMAFYNHWKEQQDPLNGLPPEPQKRYRTWEERRDSMQRADSLRYARWAAERELRYDSFKRADSMRREEWKRIRQHQYDSFRIADSLWRDSVGWRFARHEKKDTVLNLNHCDTTELLFLRGIGRYTAVQIVKYREQLGGYASVSQLLDEPLSKCHLDTLLMHFTVDDNDVRPLRVNNCNIDVLQRHPYLRYNQAKAIYDLRRKRVRINSIDELRTLPEFTQEDLSRLTPYLSFE